MEDLRGLGFHPRREARREHDRQRRVAHRVLLQAGAPGFEPGIADPKSAALPLGHAPKDTAKRIGAGDGGYAPLGPPLARLINSATRRPPLRPSCAYPSLPSCVLRASPPLRPSSAYPREPSCVLRASPPFRPSFAYPSGPSCPLRACPPRLPISR